MIVPQEGPSTVWIQQLDDNGQPTGEVKTIPGVIALVPAEDYRQTGAATLITAAAFKEFSIKLRLVAGVLREFCEALGIPITRTPITRTPLERHLLARMSRVRRARQRR